MEGPDSRHPSTGSGGGSRGVVGGGGGGHGIFGGARGIFGGGGSHGNGGGGGGEGGAGIEALSIPMVLQLRPSKAGLCRVRSKGGGDDVLEASLTRGGGGGVGGRGVGGGGGGGGGGGTGAGSLGDALTITASVQPLTKLAQLRCVVLAAGCRYRPMWRVLYQFFCVIFKFRYWIPILVQFSGSVLYHMKELIILFVSPTLVCT